MAVLEALGVAPGRLGASLMNQNIAKNDPTSWWQVVLRALQNPSKIHVTMIPNHCENAPKSKAGVGAGRLLEASWGGSGRLGASWGVARGALACLGDTLRRLGSAIGVTRRVSELSWGVLETP